MASGCPTTCYQAERQYHERNHHVCHYFHAFESVLADDGDAQEVIVRLEVEFEDINPRTVHLPLLVIDAFQTNLHLTYLAANQDFVDFTCPNKIANSSKPSLFRVERRLDHVML
jgi:hypothetical protein